MNPKTLLRPCLITLLLLTAACATKPKYPAAVPGSAGAGGSYGAGDVSESPMTGGPGSAADFAANADPRVYFGLDQYDLDSQAQQALDTQAAWLAHYPRAHIRISGNADERGTREYNFALGARRAEAVRSYLSARGVAPSRVETVSYGKERPIDTRPSEEGWARNRNAETAIVDLN